MTNTYTAEAALHHHGIKGEGNSLTDNAREAGVIYVCLGCGSIGTVPEGTPEAHRIATRDAFEWDCCEDADTILY